MEEKDLQALEFPKVIQRLAHHASSPPGKELALKLRPSADEEEVKLRLQDTREARALLQVGADAALARVRDIRSLVLRAEKGEVLSPEELLEIRSTLTAGAQVKRAIAKFSEKAPQLARVALEIAEPTELVGEIARCISERGEVADDASPLLASLRRELKETREHLFEQLEGLLRSPQVSPFVQEHFITERNGRYVIPVKAEHKGCIPGIVQDISNSGATVFIEPLSLVELGNRLRELELTEEEEVRHILGRLSNLVGIKAAEILSTLERLAKLDLSFAKARYAEELQGMEPEIVPWREPKPNLRSGATIDLKRARHPLLKPEKVVPNDIHLNDFFILVISGPNAGGKTVTLKTVGLLVLMAQAGMAIPAAEGSALSIFDGIYADIGDEQSIEQNLSTFSARITNIVRILERATPRSLVLLDELGAGTDPMEGAALARGILSHLLERGITTLAATHLSDLKAYAHATDGMSNASLQFDLETLSPTYKLRIGLPGISGALSIASRLGLSQDILKKAREWLPREAAEAEKLLAELEEAHRQAEEARQEAARTLERARAWEAELREKVSKVERERHRMLEEARREAREEVEKVLKEVRRLRLHLRQAPSPHDLEKAAEALKGLRKQLESRAPSISGKPIKVGDRVLVEGLNKSGEVIEVLEDEALVQVEGWRLRVPLYQLERKEVASEAKRPPVKLPPAPSPGLELDLRGRRAEDALRILDSYLDRAFRAGLAKVRIIHGGGTGALRRAVREWLARHPLVASFQPAPPYEGGDGATMVELAK